MQTILRIEAVEKRVGLSKGAIYARVRRDEFPQPVKLSKRSIGFLEQDVAKWIEDRVAASREGIK